MTLCMCGGEVLVQFLTKVSMYVWGGEGLESLVRLFQYV